MISKTYKTPVCVCLWEIVMQFLILKIEGVAYLVHYYSTGSKYNLSCGRKEEENGGVTNDNEVDVDLFYSDV